MMKKFALGPTGVGIDIGISVSVGVDFVLGFGVGFPTNGISSRTRRSRGFEVGGRRGIVKAATTRNDTVVGNRNEPKPRRHGWFSLPLQRYHFQDGMVGSSVRRRRRPGLVGMGMVEPRSWSSSSSSSSRTKSKTFLPLGSEAARNALADPHIRFLSLEGFVLDSGEVLCNGSSGGVVENDVDDGIDDAAPSLAYRVHGDLESGRPVVLFPTSFDAVHTDLGHSIHGSGLFDTDRCTVIVVNQLGNGVSYAPSRAPGRVRSGTFPRLFTVGDNVRAQKRLLDALGVSSKYKLAMVYGYSMGGMQAIDFAVRFPDAVEKIVVVCGSSRCGPVNEVFLESLELGLTMDPAYDSSLGFFPPTGDTVTKGLALFSTIYAGWGVGGEWYSRRGFERTTTLPKIQSPTDFLVHDYVPAFACADPNDLLSQIRTWRSQKVPGGPAEVVRNTISTHESDVLTQRALAERVKAQCLFVPCDNDRYFTVHEVQREVGYLNDDANHQADAPPKATMTVLESPLGHRAGDPFQSRPYPMEKERDFLRQHIQDFLESSL